MHSLDQREVAVFALLRGMNLEGWQWVGNASESPQNPPQSYLRFGLEPILIPAGQACARCHPRYLGGRSVLRLAPGPGAGTPADGTPAHAQKHGGSHGETQSMCQLCWAAR